MVLNIPSRTSQHLRHRQRALAHHSLELTRRTALRRALLQSHSQRAARFLIPITTMEVISPRAPAATTECFPTAALPACKYPRRTRPPEPNGFTPARSVQEQRLQRQSPTLKATTP